MNLHVRDVTTMPSMPSPPLNELVQRLRSAPAWMRKADLTLISDGPLRLADDVGDDAVAVADDAGFLLLAAEAMWPPLVESEPELAGEYAVLANVNDVYAMGGRPIAILDTLVGTDADQATAILRGLRAGARRYAAPLLGGHLTLGATEASLGVFITGRAKSLLSGRAAQAGDALLLLTARRGQFHERFPFWNCSDDRTDAELRADLEILPAIAEAGECDAGRDVSMPGVLGSALQFLEGSGVGADIDLGALPFPPESAGRELDWLLSFPSYAFLLSVAEAAVHRVDARARARGRVCARIGRVVAARRVDLMQGDERARLWDFEHEPFTGFGAPKGLPGTD